jgi:hypothetical protein
MNKSAQIMEPVSPSERVSAETRELTCESAIELMKWSFTDDDYLIMAELSTKESAGTISAKEAERLQAYLFLKEDMGLVHAKALKTLDARRQWHRLPDCYVVYSAKS